MRYSIICRAIQDKRVIEFTYDGNRRVVEPYCHRLTQQNNPGLQGY